MTANPKNIENGSNFLTFRKLDRTGRLAVPTHLRNFLHWDVNDEISVELRGHALVLRRATSCCAVCGAEDNVLKLDNGGYLCQSCIDSTRRLVQSLNF